MRGTKLLLLVAVVILTAPTAFAALQVKYNFDENTGTAVADSSGQSPARGGSVTGTTSGANSCWAAGLINNCLRFATADGYAQSVTVTTSSMTATYTGFTMSMWVYPDSALADDKYLYYNTNTTSIYGTLRLQMLAPSGNNRQLKLTITGNGNSPYIFDAVSVPGNAWTHIAFTYDKTNVVFYLNGVSRQTIACTGTKNNPVFHRSSNYTYIGNQGTTSANAFVGRLDDFRLYDAALTADQVASIAPTINATAGTGGSISPSGALTCYQGQNVAFSITPDADHAVSDVLVDGNSVGAVAAYTFNDVQANHTIQAAFKAEVSAGVIDVANFAQLEANVGQLVRLTEQVEVVTKNNGLFFIGEERFKGCVKVALDGQNAPSARFARNLTGAVTADGPNQYKLTLTAGYESISAIR